MTENEEFIFESIFLLCSTHPRYYTTNYDYDDDYELEDDDDYNDEGEDDYEEGRTTPGRKRSGITPPSRQQHDQSLQNRQQPFPVLLGTMNFLQVAQHTRNDFAGSG